MDEINIEPNPQGTIAAAFHRSWSWEQALCELIDNSFDADAASVRIEIDRKNLTVTDDGSGIPDFQRMLTAGTHTKHATTRLGRHGVGLKDAAWWFGGSTRFKSYYRGELRDLLVEWPTLKRWTLPSPGVSPGNGGRGTLISFLGIRREFPAGKAMASLLAKIGYLYTPALKRGMQITFRRSRNQLEPVQRYELPALTDVVDCEIIVEGRVAKVHVGIVPEGVANPRPGINYTHGFRVIMPSCALGCGEYSSARIAGWVSLDNGWSLSRNKDDISEHKEALGEAVYAAIKDIVAKAAKQARTYASAALSRSLTEKFRGLIGNSDEKEKRNSPSDHGRRSKGDGTSKRQNASKRQPNGRLRGRPVGGFVVDFRAFDDGALGSVDLDGGRIWLAENHPRIAEAKDTDNQLALLMTAALLFAVRDTDSGAQSLLTFVRDGSVAKAVEHVAGRLLSDERSDQLKLIESAA